jgi:uncharacterized protein (TIGR00725 family)
LSKTITVFGSSRPKPGEEEYEIAYELGRLLAKNKFNVCTGGYLGIMEAVSKGASGSGVDIIGITIKNWNKSANLFLTKEIKCDSLFDRITKLINTGDAFIILQGGTGTLLELAAVWELANKDLMNPKPVASHSPMWKEIVSIINKQMTKEGRDTNLVKSFDTIEKIVGYVLETLNVK